MKLKYQFFLNIETDEHGLLIGMMDGYEPNHKMDLVDAGEIERDANLHGLSESDAILDAIYYRYNMEHPAGYRNRSMSIGDVIVINPGTENVSAYAVASFGFDKLASFNFVVSTL